MCVHSTQLQSHYNRQGDAQTTVILEAFSAQLHAQFDLDRSAVDILHGWLMHVLTSPQAQYGHVSRAIHMEITVIRFNGEIYFQGKSLSGQCLLESLYDYCRSYEDWQFRRWLHERKASDFSTNSG
ncbi:MAG: hypothetical protein SFZ03_04240 [Candidatus Melainabacteria bacterium]|nr:hypothetical protein [Candidatus Melainabacteria bacterium]